MANLLDLMSQAPGGLMNLLNGLGQAPTMGGANGQVPQVDPAIAALAGPQALDAAKANYFRNLQAGMQDVAAHGGSLGMMMNAPGVGAGNQYSADVRQAAQDAMQLRMLRMAQDAQGGATGDPFSQLNAAAGISYFNAPAGEAAQKAAMAQIGPAELAYHSAQREKANGNADAAYSYYIQFLKATGRLNVADRTGTMTLLGGITPRDLQYLSIDPRGTITGPSGQSVIPGAPGAQGRIAGAVKAAESANTIGPVPNQGGGSTFGYYGNYANQRPNTPPGASQAPPGAAPAPQSPATTQAAPNAPQTAADKAWATMPKLVVPQGTGAPDYFTQGKLQEAGKKDADLSSQLGQEAHLADQQLEYGREAMADLTSAETGPLSDWLTRNRSALLEAGMPAALIPGDGSVTPTLELNKALKNSALQGARALYGQKMTQMEVKLQTDEMSPSASMTKDAIRSLQQQNNVRSAYAKQRAADYQTYRQSGGDPMAFETWYSKQFPITAFAKAAMVGPAAIQAEMRRRGLSQ